MDSFNPNTINMSRLMLRDWVTRPQEGILLLPSNPAQTTLTVNITSTTFVLTFISGSPTVITINYVGLSLGELVDQINRSALPIRALALSHAIYLASDFIFPTGGAKTIPDDFPLHDRRANNGVVIRLGSWTVRHDRIAQISALAPYTAPSSLPWYPRILAGEFTSSFEGRIYHFSVPEFDDQSWSSRYGKPFRDVNRVPISPIGKNIYQLPRGPVYWAGGNLVVYHNDQPLPRSAIEDVDIYNQILYLQPEVVITSKIDVSYTYLEKSYEYKFLNINAHFTQNPTVLGKFVVLYAVPTAGEVAPTTRSIYHIIADSIPEAIDQISSNIIRTPYAILGAYHPQQLFSADQVTILDTRSLGGGLVMPTPKAAELQLNSPLELLGAPIKKIEDVYQDSKSHYDIGHWDGESYPGSASVVIDLPDSLRNTLEDKDIISRAKKFLAAGVKPLVTFSNRDLPAVTGLTSQASLFQESLTGSTQGHTGLGWQPVSLSIPDNTVLEPWDSSFDIRTPIVIQDGVSVLQIDSTGYQQSYLKSSPIAGIRYERRDLLGDRVYSQWRTIAIEDDRDLPRGQLTKGFLTFNPELVSYQVKNIEVNCPYHIETGSLLDEVVTESLIIRNAISGEQRPGSYAIDNIRTDSRVVDTIPDSYYGYSTLYRGIFDLAATSVATGFNNLASGAAFEIPNAIGLSGILFYTYSDGSYSAVESNSTEITRSIDLLAKSCSWLYTGYGAGNSTLTGQLNWLANSLNYIGRESVNYLTPFFSIDNSGVHSPIQLSIGIRPNEIDPNLNQDYLGLDIAGVGYKILDSIPNWTGVDISSFLDRTMGSVALLGSRLPDALTGIPYLDTSTEVANHWFTSHGRLGGYGRVAKNITYILTDLTTAYGRLGGAPFPKNGLDGSSAVLLLNLLTTILDLSRTKLANIEGLPAILDNGLSDLLYSFEWYSQNIDNILTTTTSGIAMNLDLNGDGSITNADHALAAAFSQSYIDKGPGYAIIVDKILPYLIKGMVTTEGQIYETTIVQQQPGPFPKTLPANTLELLSLVGLRDSQWLNYLQGYIRTTIGTMSSNGHYPTEPTYRVDKRDRGQDYLLVSLARVVKNLETIYDQTDVAALERKIATNA